MNWLKKEVQGSKLIDLMFNCIILHFTWSLSMVGIAHLLKINIPPVTDGETEIYRLSFPFMLFSYAWLEEMLFRFPLMFFIEERCSITKVLAASVVLSVVFGLVHGSVYHIFIQGVGGFIYCILFLKAGGLQRKYVKAIAVTTTSHFLFNATAIGIAALGGRTSI